MSFWLVYLDVFDPVAQPKKNKKYSDKIVVIKVVSHWPGHLP